MIRSVSKINNSGCSLWCKGLESD